MFRRGPNPVARGARARTRKRADRRALYFGAMGAIDSLLGLVESQHARGLVIAVGEAPQLVLVDRSEPLSMPILAAEQVEAFAREVGSVLAKSSRYETSSGRVFEVRVDGKGPSLRLSFTRTLGESAAADAVPASHPSTP